MADNIRATPQNPYTGALARGLRSLQQLAGQYQVDPRIPLLGGTSVDELLSLPGAASLAEDVSYYGPRALIRGGNVATGGIGTFRLDPRVADVADVAMNVTPLAAMAGKTATRGAMAAGRAGERLAERVVPQVMERGGIGAQLMQDMATGSRSQVVKPKGGNWLAGSVEKAIEPMRAKVMGYEPSVRLQTIDEEIKKASQAGLDPETMQLFMSQVGREQERLAPQAAMNRWLDQKLAKYIKNEMATPEDPIRALAESWPARQQGLLAAKDSQIAKARADMEAARAARGFTPEMMTNSQARIRGLEKERELIEARGALHVAPEQVGVNRYRAPEVRRAMGYPEEGLGQSEVAKAWEAASDVALRKTYAEAPWSGGKEVAFYSDEPRSFSGLGFEHLTDELKNALNPASGLPENLLLKYADLEKKTVPDIVNQVADINAWRAVQKAEVDKARASNVATQIFKEYPESPQGLRWVELRLPKETGKKTTVERSELDEFGMGVDDATLREVAEEMAFDEGLEEGTRAFNDFVNDTIRAHNTKRPVEVDESVKALEDALKYEGEVLKHCVGGYCPDVIEGRSKIFSLRDKKGQPHVTIEVAPQRSYGSEHLNAQRAQAEAEALAQGLDPEKSGFSTFVNNRMSELAVQNLPQSIVQIKGKKNQAPASEYLPYVQDFVRSQNWGKIGDLKNAGLVQLPDKRLITNEQFDEAISRISDGGDRPTNEWFLNVMRGDPSWWEEMKGAFEGFSQGGQVRGYAQGGLVANFPTYDFDPDRIDSIVGELHAMNAG